MKILHLTASPFFGGPERVILDIIRTQAEAEFDIESLVVSFRENGNSEPFMQEIAKAGFSGLILDHDMPHLVAAYRDLVRLFKNERIDIVCAHGHKARLLGWLAARKVGIPIIGVSHGWTWQDWKVSLYERLDQWVHHRMDRVICVSQGQADKVLKTGTPQNRIAVIHNAIDVKRFDNISDRNYRTQIENYFDSVPKLIVGAAGRLSPEKGYDVLIDAVKITVKKNPALSFGVVLFGEGFLRQPLQERVDAAGIADRFKMVGFTLELDKYLPHVDLFVQSSHTEGFPCVNIEAMAARVPVLATAVGGVPEQIISDETGLLVPPNDPSALANGLQRLLLDLELRKKFGERGHQKAVAEFTCREQAKKYKQLFQEIPIR